MSIVSNNDFNNSESKVVYTVSQINEEIKFLLEASYPSVWIAGEISGFRLYNSGHMYFYVKDDKSQIKAVMFQNENTGLTFIPKDGMQVLAFGRISSYPVRGDYQIIVNKLEEFGEGGLAKEFEKLKNKLSQEGLFDKKYKKEIPSIVCKVGVVTSIDGAALRDILKVIDDLGANVEILIAPTKVQGKNAELEIVEAIKLLNKKFPNLDVLLIGRGGGSVEDLCAFNSEAVARAIFSSKIPTVSCVGHETDFTISDFTADMRAPTPSAAAEMILRGKLYFYERLGNLKKELSKQINFIVEKQENNIKRLALSRALTKPHLIYEDRIKFVEELNSKILFLTKRLFNLKESVLGNIAHKLDILSPLSVLKRGFSVCFNERKEIIKNSNNVNIGEIINVKLRDGNLKAEIKGNG